MNKELYEKHFEIRRQIEKLEEDEIKVKEEIMAELATLEARKYSSHWGTWSVATKVSWTYSDEVKNIREAAKRKEKEEQENGLAVSETVSYLRFQAVKIHKNNLKESN